MLLLALHGLTTGAYAYLVGPLLRFIYSGGESTGSRMTRVLDWLGWSPSENAQQLTSIIAVLVISLVLTKGMAYFGGSYLVAVAGQRMEHELRVKLYAHLLEFSFARLSEIPRGDMVSRFIYDVSALKIAVTHGLTNIFRDVLQIIVLASLAVSLDPLLGLLALCVLPISTTVILRIGKRLRKRRRRVFDAYGDLGSTTEQTAAALPVIRVFGAEEQTRTKFRDLSQRLLDRNLRAWALQVFSSPLMELLGAIALAATLWYAGHRIGSGALQPEEFVSFFAAVFMMYRPIKSLGDASSHVHTGFAALDRIDQLMAIESEPRDPADAYELKTIDHAIRYEDVSFAYPESEHVVEGASFEIAAGETVALVGPSGSGKTTLAMMLLRLIDPSSGRIRVDGRDATTISRTSLRRSFSLVTQEPVLLNDTIRANVSLGYDATDEEIESALAAAGALAFVESLPDKLDAQVGESGGRLSGGEKQRLCIARALLRNSEALILDEATASVDSATEAEISAALEKLMVGRTTLMISHRLSTVRRANKIIVLENGHIVDSGDFEALSQRSEPFKKLFADQL